MSQLSSDRAGYMGPISPISPLRGRHAGLENALELEGGLTLILKETTDL
jgi:hypothetical protein